jgi:class 3 adenylate cyclase
MAMFTYPSIRNSAGISIFFALILAILAMSSMAFVQALQWIDRPFPGFLVNQRLVVGGVGLYHWTGSQAGLKIPDKILTADHKPVSNVFQLDAIVRSMPVGSPLHYTLGRSGTTAEVIVPTMRFSFSDWLAIYGVYVVLGFIYLSIAAIVYILKPGTVVSWVFGLVCFCISTFVFTSFDTATTHAGFLHLYIFSAGFIPATGVHFSMIFPEKRTLVARYPLLQAMPYLLSMGIVLLMESFYPGPIFLALYRVLQFYLVFAAAAIVLSCLVSYVWQSSIIARQRSKVVLFGAAIAFPLPALGQLASFLGGTVRGMQIEANLFAIPLIMFPASIGYAIAKHNLFDVDVYIKRTVGYVLMTMIVGLGYFTIEMTSNSIVVKPLLGSSADRVFPIVFALLVVFFFHPINRRVQDSVDKMFFRKMYDYKASIASVGDALTSLLDVHGFLTKVIQTVRQDLFVDKAGVLLLDTRQNSCESIFMTDSEGSTGMPQIKRDPCLASDDPLLTLLAQEKKMLTKYDIAEDPRYAGVRQACGQRFSELGASVALPLFYHGEFTGALALGYKKSGHFYTREDIDLLKTLSSMTSTAIEQSREKGQRAVLMQLFSKHVSPQVADSLWDQREQFLDGGRPKSQKFMVTTMFTDLQGFSTLSEKQDPQMLMDWLNTYMEMVTRVVMDHSGVVDDFFGDGVKVNFGVPIPRTSETEIRQDAVNAVTCALALERELMFLNKRMKGQGNPTLRMRVGIYTGSVVAGSLGSADRMKYTTLGDTVNTAARLESFDKDLHLPHLETSPVRILIGDSTLQLLDEQFECQLVGELSLKGKAEKIKAYCILKRAEAKSAWAADAESE